MRSIKVLPESVRRSMRSGVILFDLTRVVEELVFNSLDAGATKVIVAVGVGTSYIKVTDNGCGITRDGLVLLGERYATSKVEQLAGINSVPENFGFRGEALSSIADVSLLEVFTKAHAMPNGYRKVMKGCKCLYLGIDDDRKDVGTTVVVHDLFYNQPVKRRRLQSSPKKVLHSVKECMVNIALVHLATCFKVVDTESGDELLSTYPASSPLPLLKSCFGIEISRSLHKLDESDGNLKLSGYISGPYETFSVKAFQYFYINSRYISRGPIQKLLSQLAAMHDSPNLLKADIRSHCGKRSRVQASPTYILNLSCPQTHYDLSFEPAKTCVEFKDWDPVFTFIKNAVSCFWSEGAHVSKEDDIWSGVDTSSTRVDILNNHRLPKKRCLTKCNQDSVTLSPPQLEMLGEEPNHMPLGRYSCNLSQRNAIEDYSYTAAEDICLENKEHMNLSDANWHPDTLLTGCSTNNGLLVKRASPVSFHFDDDLMKPFLRSCSSRMDTLPAVKSTRGGDKLRFQADEFKEWLYMDDNKVDNKDMDNIIQGSKPWIDDGVTVWSPPKITTSKGSSGMLLTGEDCLTEDISHWLSPAASVQYSKSYYRSSKGDWSAFGEKIDVEPLTDVVSKRHFEHGRNDGFDLFGHEEEERGICSFGFMRSDSYGENCKKNTWSSRNDSILSPQQCDFLYESDWTRSSIVASHHMPSLSYADRERSKISDYRILDKQRRRSSSAPPFYKEKKKIIALNSWVTAKSGKSCHETFDNAPILQGASHKKHTEKLSANDLQSKAKHDKKKIGDKAEISDEGKVARSLDVYNTDSDFSKEKQDGLDFGVKWRNGCPLTTSIQKPNDLANQEKILDISSGVLHLSGDSLLPKSTSKKCIEDCRVLYQVDKKFIPVVGGGILAVIDQHAADERIRLEELREKVLFGESKTITYLDAEQELVLPEIGYQLLNNYSEQIQKWGWICNFHAQSSVSFKKNLNFLNNQTSVATLIAVPCILGVNLTDVDLLEFLQQLADTDGSSVMPPAVLRVLNFKACRGAIMFGDALLPSECSLIVEELKKTSMCFQCAHGRPTTAPLVNLVALHKQIAKLGNRSPGSSGRWHGLSRNKPSLERAAHRLSQ
ncbi:hypothetical protein QVD17_37066 [Tagetes erecta]|uniref:DNA mismatch repair protein MLH3 n=1 Tax=Tagetes erecta TaxID=13708 RepID=A0AAD8JTK8_TARER|nr:hypothetical protein QVD17_37066 [Tagetes erecta]